MGRVYTYNNLVEALEAGASETARGFTFVDRDQKENFVSWAELRHDVRRRAAHLRRHGLKKGDRLAVVMPDGEDFIPTFLGALYAGIVPVPLYPPLSLGKLDTYIETLVAILSKAEPMYLATPGKLQQVLWSGLSRVKGLHGVITAEELREPAPEGASQEPAQVTGEDTAFLQFTSGSTSTPKGVVVSHENLRANAWAINRDGLNTDDETDRAVSWLPLYHDMGLIGFVIATLFHRIQATFIPTLSFVRSAPIWLQTISRQKATITFAPNFAYALAAKRVTAEQKARWDLSSMRHFGCGAEPINPATMRNFLETFRECGLKPQALLPAYGMAEATLAITFIGEHEELSCEVIDRHVYETDRAARRLTDVAHDPRSTLELVSCGRPFPGHELAIFDDQDRRLGERQVGEVRLRGPSVARGYYNDAEATQRAFGGGWLRTGDLGYLADGNLFISGRKKDLIIINGRNYDPQRIEWLVDELPGIRKGSTVAFSRPGATSEELVVVVEGRSADHEQLAEAVKQTINEQLQLTVADVFVAPPGSLPKTSSGKLQRARTRSLYLDGQLGVHGARPRSAQAEQVMVAKHVTLSLLGRSQHRARRILHHTMEIRTVEDAVGKLRLAQDYLQKRVSRLFS